MWPVLDRFHAIHPIGSTYSRSSPGFHTNSSCKLCLLALSLYVQWHTSAFLLLGDRVRVTEREHVALESIVSFTPSVRSQATEWNRERQGKQTSYSWTFPRVQEWISSDTLDVNAQLWGLRTEGIFKVLLTERVLVSRTLRRVCDRSVLGAMSGVTRKGSGRPGYYYRLLGRTRLQRQRSRSRSRSRATTNRGKLHVITLHYFWNIFPLIF